MDEGSVCTPQFAESDAQNNITSTPVSVSATDADKVINTKTDSTQVEGGKSDEELLSGLLTDDYCHVCEAVLLFESQRLSHYEGKKHSQKLKVYLQAKRTEKMKKESGPQRMLAGDKDRFCELCNMVFSSPVVAKSHYEGKVHSKNLRKQSLQAADRHTEVNTLPSLNHDYANDDHKSASEDGGEPPVDPSTTTSAAAGAELDLKDPNKYCVLCAASFNNPQMAMQHYNGRKHQRNAARQELLRELGDDGYQDSRLKCQICSVQFNSVEMYQAHMQGNKHHTREKKVIDLCKSQQKSYSTFADELADYIQVQKARGLDPKTGQAPAAADAPEEDEQQEVEGFSKAHFPLPGKPMASHPPVSNLPPHHSGSYYPAEGCRPLYQGASWVSGGWDYNCPPLSLPGSRAPPFNMGPLKRPRRRRQSSSSSASSSTSSSSSSSYSSSYSSTSGSEHSEHRQKERRRPRRSRKERGRRARDEDSDKQARRRRQHRRAREGEEEDEGRGDGHRETEKDRRRKRPKNHNKRRRREKGDLEEEKGERGAVCLQPAGDVAPGGRETEVHIQTEISVEQQQDEERADETAKPKIRREKKKTTREKVDTRTEEEKLWDDSILGC